MVPRFQVATTCFSCSPPDLNLLVTNFISCRHVKLPQPLGDNPIAVNNNNNYYYYYYYYYSRPSVTPTQNNRQDHSSIYFNVYTFLNAILILLVVPKYLKDSTLPEDLLPVFTLWYCPAFYSQDSDNTYGRIRLQRYRFMRHLMYNVWYSVVPVNSSHLTTT